MGCPYTYLDTGEVEEHLARYDRFLQQAANGDTTVSDYRAVLPDRRFISGLFPDEQLQELVLGESEGNSPYRHGEILDILQDDDHAVTVHGSDLAGEYLHMARHVDNTSTLGRYLGAMPRMIMQKGYDRTEPTGSSIDALEDERDSPGIVGRLTPSNGTTGAVLLGGVGTTATGAVIGDPALMDMGTVVAYSSLPMAGSNMYHHGRDEQYADAIAAETADIIEQEIGGYTVDVVESGPFRLLTQE